MGAAHPLGGPLKFDYHNIYISDIKSTDCVVYSNNGWETISSKLALFTFVTKKIAALSAMHDKFRNDLPDEENIKIAEQLDIIQKTIQLHKDIPERHHKIMICRIKRLLYANRKYAYRANTPLA